MILTHSQLAEKMSVKVEKRERTVFDVGSGVEGAVVGLF